MVQATNGTVTHIVPIAVTLGADFSIALGNSTETVSTGGSTTDTITVTPAQGFTGSVALSCTPTLALG